MRRVILSLSLTLAGAVGAQQPPTIDPGMTRAQVLDRLGKPNAERTAGAYTHLFFPNGCEERCGMSDLVILRGDSVVDAIFRTPARRYSGRSSSPAEVPPSASQADTVPGRAPARTLPVTSGGRLPPGYSGGIVLMAGPRESVMRIPLVKDAPQTPGLVVPPRDTTRARPPR